MDRKQEVLRQLREADEYVSGQQLCEALGVSRTAVWKIIKKLKEDGYPIEAVTNKGYRLLSVEGKDLLNQEELERRLNTRWAGHPLFYMQETGSTNTDIFRFSEEGYPQGTLAVSAKQTAGKGRRGRTWISPPDVNIYMSILLKPGFKPETAPMLTLVMALAVHRACEELYGAECDFGIKWPNDIYWKQRKISGTRIDGNIQAGKLSDMVIGTGININQSEFHGTAPNPVSLTQITGRTYNRQAILYDIIARFSYYLNIAKQEWMMRKECPTIHSEYHRHLFRKEGIHSYEDANGQFDAKLVEVLPNGIMQLERTDGTISEYEFKEVKFCLDGTNENK